MKMFIYTDDFTKCVHPVYNVAILPEILVFCSDLVGDMGLGL